MNHVLNSVPYLKYKKPPCFKYKLDLVNLATFTPAKHCWREKLLAINLGAVFNKQGKIYPAICIKNKQGKIHALICINKQGKIHPPICITKQG